MSTGRDQFKSSYGTFTARERELERSRARRDVRDATRDPANTEDQPAPTADRPSP
jgi:hypothetical protein